MTEGGRPESSLVSPLSALAGKKHAFKTVILKKPRRERNASKRNTKREAVYAEFWNFRFSDCPNFVLLPSSSRGTR